MVLANNKFNYPDCWDGPAAFQSTIYPDSWTPAHEARKQKTMRYDEEVEQPSVPAFVGSVTDWMHKSSRQSKQGGKPFLNTSSQPVPKCKRSKKKKRYPLSEWPAKKRMATNQLPENQSFKRPKFEASSQTKIIDLTQDENVPPAQKFQSNIARPMTANRNRSKRPNPQQQAANAHQAEAIAAGTDDLLKEIMVQLDSSLIILNKHRDLLRNRWEVDKRLQLLTVTDHLRVLNECFAEAEKGLLGSVDVIQHFIM